MIGSKQQLAVLLSKLKTFQYPNLALEQYSTDSEIAAAMLWEAYMQQEIQGKRVADLGCGTGILGIGALALEAKHVVFIELDAQAFPILMENLHFLEEELGEEFSNYEIIQGNIAEYTHNADLVIQNPPFGTQDKHADLLFLEKALALAPIVYSLHKGSTVEYLRSWAAQRHARIVQVRNFQFPLKQTMRQHQKKVQYIDVVCLKLQQ